MFNLLVGACLVALCAAVCRLWGWGGIKGAKTIPPLAIAGAMALLHPAWAIFGLVFWAWRGTPKIPLASAKIDPRTPGEFAQLFVRHALCLTLAACGATLLLHLHGLLWTVTACLAFAAVCTASGGYVSWQADSRGRTDVWEAEVAMGAAFGALLIALTWSS